VANQVVRRPSRRQPALLLSTDAARINVHARLRRESLVPARHFGLALSAHDCDTHVACLAMFPDLDAWRPPWPPSWRPPTSRSGWRGQQPRLPSASGTASRSRAVSTTASPQPLLIIFLAIAQTDEGVERGKPLLVNGEIGIGALEGAIGGVLDAGSCTVHRQGMDGPDLQADEGPR